MQFPSSACTDFSSVYHQSSHHLLGIPDCLLVTFSKECSASLITDWLSSSYPAGFSSYWSLSVSKETVIPDWLFCSYPAALALVSGGTLDVKTLVTHHFRLAETEAAFSTAAARDSGAVKVIIRCDE